MKLQSFNKFKYAVIFAALALLPHEAKGQGGWWDQRVINPFLSPDTTDAAKAYNAINGLSLEDITARNNLWAARVQADRTHTIQAAPNRDYPNFGWWCSHWTHLQIVNAWNWGDSIYNGEVPDAKLLYNGYKGWDLTQIYANGGTFADQGKLGVPLMTISFTAIASTGEEHIQTTLLTGNHALIGNNWNDTEPRDGTTQLQPGASNTNIPLNCNDFTMVYPFIYKNVNHNKILGGFIILKFKIVNGEKILTYNINDDPNFNQYVHLITDRENDPPKINIRSSEPDSLIMNIDEANPKSQYMIIDNGAPIPLTTKEKRYLWLPAGTHTIKITAEDYFNLKSEVTFQRTVTAPVNFPPKITFINPKEGAMYTDDIKLEYTITDTDFASATYKIDNGAKISITQNGSIPLSLTDGCHKIVIEATDRKPRTSKDSVNFCMSLPQYYPPKITIITPAEGEIYTDDIKLQYNITDADNDFASAIYWINEKIDERKSLAQSGTIPLSLQNGQYILTIDAKDSRGLSTQGSVKFTINKPTGIEKPPSLQSMIFYPNPAENSLHLKYKEGLSANAFMTITTLDGKPVICKRINGITEETIDISNYKSTIYIINIIDGLNKQSARFIKK